MTKYLKKIIKNTKLNLVYKNKIKLNLKISINQLNRDH